MNKKIIALFLFLIFSPVLVSAQTASFNPASKNLLQNQRFDLNLNVSSTADLAGLSFDLKFDPSLVSFLEASDGGFFSAGGGQVSMAATGNAGGSLSFSINRLGGGQVSGNGTAAKLSFRTLAKQGETTMVFSNNSFCVLSGGSCNNISGSWQGATLKVLNTPNDSSAPTAPTALSLIAASSTAVNLSWAVSTDNIEVIGYRIFRDNSRIAEVTTTAYQDTGLVADTFYSYAVSAFDNAGNESFQSAQVSIKTPEKTEASSAPVSYEPSLDEIRKQIQELIKLVAQLQLKVFEILKARGR